MLCAKRGAGAMEIRIPPAAHRFAVEQFGDFGPWQVREIISDGSRIVATCPNEEEAEVIAKFMNGNVESALKAHRQFLSVREDEDA
jgi:hypothetical protein